MSILDFARHLGRQVFDRDDVAADKIKETMEITLSPIKDLSVDTLSGIAKRYYGDAMQYMKIFEANTGVIEDPNKIYPGQKIRIPAA